MKLRIAVLALLVAGVAGLAASGAYQSLAPAQLRETVLGLGPLGPVLFVLAFALLEPFHFPGLVFLLTAPLVWSPPVAFLLSWAGGIGAGVVAIVIARWLARDWVQQHLPEQWRAWDERLARHGWRSVVVIRLFTFLLPAAHWAIGLSRVGTVPAIVGTAIGLAPGVLLCTWLGMRTPELMKAISPGWVAAIAVVVLAGLAVRHQRRRGAAEAAALATGSGSSGEAPPA